MLLKCASATVPSMPYLYSAADFRRHNFSKAGNSVRLDCTVNTFPMLETEGFEMGPDGKALRQAQWRIHNLVIAISIAKFFWRLLLTYKALLRQLLFQWHPLVCFFPMQLQRFVFCRQRQIASLHPGCTIGLKAPIVSRGARALPKIPHFYSMKWLYEWRVTASSLLQ